MYIFRAPLDGVRQGEREVKEGKGKPTWKKRAGNVQTPRKVLRWRREIRE